MVNGTKQVVDFPRMKCPKCGTYDPHVTSSEYPIRFHRCRNAACNFGFRSYDSGPPKMTQERLGAAETLPEGRSLDTGQPAKPTAACEGVTLDFLRRRNGRKKLSAAMHAAEA
jgi:ssDNA-binding Zn-finger/Zn-ribbon topoisomerase 1